jgi:enoyl-CoA hydratase/carnithine racemase
MTATEYGRDILFEKKGTVGWITFNRPQKRNAISRNLQAELRAALADAKGVCNVLVLTGNGPAFCAGVDLSETPDPAERHYAHGGNSWGETNEILRRHPAVTIAAVNGYALGGGLTLTNNCELAIASDRAQFGMPEVGFGMFPGLAGPATIRRIAPKHAAQMILTAARIDAATAERWGIVNEVVPHERLLERADELSQHIAKFDPTVLDYSKKAIHDIEMMPWAEAITYGIYIGGALRAQTTAARDGIEKFLSGQPNPGQGANA